MDEPESIAALSLAAREQLDNLHLRHQLQPAAARRPGARQRPIIDELESLFTGAGWNVIKVLWGSDWDALFARDHDHALLRALRAHRRRPVPDALGARTAPTTASASSARTRSCRRSSPHLRDEDIDRLRRGGHDVRKLHAAFAAARRAHAASRP